MAEWRKSAKALKDILGMASEPVAVKFFEEYEDLNDFQMCSERRYCQVLMGARHGEKLLLTPVNIACPAAAWAIGFKPPPQKLSSGEMPAAMGIFGSSEAARNTLSTMCRLGMNNVNGLTKLNERALPGVREKAAYKALLSRKTDLGEVR